MAEAAADVVYKTIETKMFEAFIFYLRMTQKNLTISVGVACTNESKFSLVCYTNEKLTEAQANSFS